MMMLNHLSERLRFRDGTSSALGAHGSEASSRRPKAHATSPSSASRAACRYGATVGDLVSRRGCLMPHRQNTVHVTLPPAVAGKTRAPDLRPLVRFRPHEAPVDDPASGPTRCRLRRPLRALRDADLPPLRLVLHGDRRRLHPRRPRTPNVVYRLEADRGYECERRLWSPGYFRVDADAGRARCTLIASTETWETIGAQSRRSCRQPSTSAERGSSPSAHPACPQAGPAAELVLAADQFIITPAGRAEEAARARATRRRGAHGDRRLPLVHRLGPRHDDQPRGADAVDRPPARGRRTSCAPSRTTCATA